MSRLSTDAARVRLAVGDEQGGLRLEEREPPLLLDSLFGRAGPVELEIGAGKGRFVAERAACEPERNFLAVERARRYAAKMCERLAKRRISNVRVLLADARTVLEEYLPPASLAGVHVYFPDPWPKRRHHKRRLLQPLFVQALERALAPAGFLSVASDVKSYMELIVECVSGASRLLELVRRSVNERPESFPTPTNFEVKYRRAGRSLYFALWAKRSS